VTTPAPTAAPAADPLARLESFLARAEGLLQQVATLLPPAPPAPDWERAVAFRWRRLAAGVGGGARRGFLQALTALPPITLDDLRDIDDQKERVDANTRQFVAGRPANNVLLTGTRGCGKSSLIKAIGNAYAKKGLRLIEVDKDDLVDLPDIVAQLEWRPERFIIFCDDLSFEAGDPAYKALKVVLDGSLAATPDNVLIYATSNRRHLMPEYMAENLETKHVGEEVHPGEATEEKISLSERFGLWVSFYPFSQENYLSIVNHWLAHFGCSDEEITEIEREALNWALGRGSRSGRVAWQFAKDWAGRKKRNGKGKS
jgi:predicted AAA+ superfamily ATPase